MKPKILINIQAGQISAISNGNIELHVHDLDNLNGIQRLPAKQIPAFDFELLIAPSMPARDIPPMPKAFACLDRLHSDHVV